MKPWLFSKLPLAIPAGAFKTNYHFGEIGAKQYALRRSAGKAKQRLRCPIDQATSRHFGTNRDNGTPRRVYDGLSHRAYIALGSNLGNRVGMIEKACKMMEADGNIRISKSSSLYETEPMYVRDQNSFINGVCEIYTRLEPNALLNRLKAIENEMGRIKIIEKGPRNIDLDILLYDTMVMENENLTIPHKLMLEREFVLRPLCDLVPEGYMPGMRDQITFQSYLTQLPEATSPIHAVTMLDDNDMNRLTSRTKGQKTRIMSILNVTPDSFSDGGQNNPQDLANLKKTILSHIEAGTNVIDVGGQSSRPNAPSIGTLEEIKRISPVIEYIRSLPEAQNIPISIDTYRSSVAKVAVSAGASIVNDISAGTLDSAMLPTVAELGCTLCLMHMRGNPSTMAQQANYPDGVVQAVGQELLVRLDAAQEAGVRRWRIILDPGIGFAKNSQQNLELLRNFAKLKSFAGFQNIPWLIGTSRKGYIGTITNVREPKDRIWGTAAAVAAAVHGGADIVRVHDVAEMGLVSKMADAIWNPVNP